MPRSGAVDDFTLAYDRTGTGPPVVLLHGWPGDRRNFRAVVALLSGCEAVVPDLRGFGESEKHRERPERAYSAAAQARSVLALIDELGLEAPVVAGYNIGTKEMHEAFAGLAAEDSTTPRGAPKNPLQLGATLWHFRHESRPTSPPIWAGAKAFGVRAYHDPWDSRKAPRSESTA